MYRSTSGKPKAIGYTNRHISIADQAVDQTQSGYLDTHYLGNGRSASGKLKAIGNTNKHISIVGWSTKRRLQAVDQTQRNI